MVSGLESLSVFYFSSQHSFLLLNWRLCIKSLTRIQGHLLKRKYFWSSFSLSLEYCHIINDESINHFIIFEFIISSCLHWSIIKKIKLINWTSKINYRFTDKDLFSFSLFSIIWINFWKIYSSLLNNSEQTCCWCCDGCGFQPKCVESETLL